LQGASSAFVFRDKTANTGPRHHQQSQLTRLLWGRLQQPLAERGGWALLCLLPLLLVLSWHLHLELLRLLGFAERIAASPGCCVWLLRYCACLLAAGGMGGRSPACTAITRCLVLPLLLR